MTRERVERAITLVYPDMDRKFYLATNASEVGGAVILYQEHQGRLVPVHVYSFVCQPSEQKLHIGVKELEAVCRGVDRFHQYLVRQPFVLLMDCMNVARLLSPNGKRFKNDRLNRRAMKLGIYTFETVYVPSKMNVLKDYVSHYPTKPQQDTAMTLFRVDTRATQSTTRHPAQCRRCSGVQCAGEFGFSAVPRRSTARRGTNSGDDGHNGRGDG